MNEEMITFFKQLNTNEKRNELSGLLIKLDQLINELMIKKDINVDNFENVKNYDSIKQSLQNEDDTLLFFYDDVWTIKTKILALLYKNQI